MIRRLLLQGHFQNQHPKTFSPAQVAQFEAWYEECYNVQDDTYLALYHPPSPESVSSAATSKTTSVTSSASVGTSASSSKSLPSSEEVLAELLASRVLLIILILVHKLIL